VSYRGTTGATFREILGRTGWSPTLETNDGYVVLSKPGHSQSIAFFLRSQLTTKIIRNFCNNAKISEAEYDQLIDDIEGVDVVD
jgi:hypothetical protein